MIFNKKLMDKIRLGFFQKNQVLNPILQIWTRVKTQLKTLLALLIIVSLAGCGNSSSEVPPQTPPTLTISKSASPISQVSPPKLIQKLHQSLDAYQPQVTILNPKPDQLIEDDTINLQLQVQGLPLFQDPKFGLGPHLQVILDNQPNIDIYDITTPITFPNLDPGTHTLRVFAAYPWDESYKNEGSFAQTTFHVFTKTPDHDPDQNLPLLTYNRPQGVYGAEPILLDFHLNNAPLHIVAQDNPTDEIVDWQIRITLNGESFTTDKWQPLYLKGLKPGKNWVQIEYLNEQGNPVDNVFNKTARVITYNPNFKNTISQLTQEKLSFAEVKGILNPNFATQDLIETSEPEEFPNTEPEVISTPVDEPLEETTPEAELIVEPETTPSETIELIVEPETTPSETIESIVESETTPSETIESTVESETTPSETIESTVESETTPSETIESTVESETTPSETIESIVESETTPLETIATEIPAEKTTPDISPESLIKQLGEFLSRFHLPFLNPVQV
ncbi:FHA domain containing protein [Planktothrix agardhii]|nr:FHA domain containing protein [Planktothrix agardhii]